MKALNKNQIPVYDELIVGVEVNAEKATQAVIETIDKGIRFDGIFAGTDWLAVGALTALNQKGRKVPDDVRIVGFDDITIGKYLTPKLSTIQQDKWKMGQLAMECLMELMKNQTKNKKGLLCLST